MSSPPQRLSGADLGAALGVVVIWGLNFVAMKFALRDFTPFQLGAVRYLFAVLPLALFIRPPKVAWKWVLLYGLCQGVGQFGFLFSALQAGMTAALASVLMQTQVFFTALFGFFLLHERMSRPLVGGLTLAAAGLICFGMNFVAGGGLAGADCAAAPSNQGAPSDSGPSRRPSSQSVALTGRAAALGARPASIPARRAGEAMMLLGQALSPATRLARLAAGGARPVSRRWRRALAA